MVIFLRCADQKGSFMVETTAWEGKKGWLRAENGDLEDIYQLMLHVHSRLHYQTFKQVKKISSKRCKYHGGESQWEELIHVSLLY
jgi:hypothetical protein